MDPVQFLELLETPFNLDPERMKELKHLSEKHPYCQLLAYLNSRYLLEQNHPDFQNSSRQCYVLAVNRKMFRDYITGKLNPLRPKPVSLKLYDEDDLTKQNNESENSGSNTFSKPKNSYNLPTFSPAFKKPYEHLIDKFIKEEPRISAPTKDFPKENLAEKLNHKQQELVTETLAKVYLQQGFVADAIDIFEKLSLKNPEKSSYFAKIIRNLKKQQKI
jgi:hypothetical protein